MDHPLWCDTERCTADQPGGVHMSDDVTLVNDMHLSLTEPPTPGAQAVITIAALESPDPDNPYERFFVPAIHASTLATGLTRMSAAALEATALTPAT